MAPVGREFLLVSRLSGHALGVDSAGGANDPVVTCVRNEADKMQIWREDQPTGTIRLSINGLCLHVGDDNTLRLQTLDPGSSCQLWSYRDGKIQNATDSAKVLDVSGSKTEPGSSVCSWEFHGGPNQLFDQVFLAPKCFYLKSELNGKVLDVDGQNPAPGTKLCVWDQKPEDSADNQLWYEDEKGILRSCLNDFVIDGSHPEALVMQPFDAGLAAVQSWVVDGSSVALRPKLEQVIDVADHCTESGARVCAWERHGGTNQRWVAEFVVGQRK